MYLFAFWIVKYYSWLVFTGKCAAQHLVFAQEIIRNFIFSPIGHLQIIQERYNGQKSIFLKRKRPCFWVKGQLRIFIPFQREWIVISQPTRVHARFCPQCLSKWLMICKFRINLHAQKMFLFYFTATIFLIWRTNSVQTHSILMDTDKKIQKMKLVPVFSAGRKRWSAQTCQTMSNNWQFYFQFHFYQATFHYVFNMAHSIHCECIFTQYFLACDCGEIFSEQAQEIGSHIAEAIRDFLV
jgi:hypothetical protein